ncbi:MAG: serine/threonine-protein kinase [Pirellulaceae bacterium]|nr:serine/threonine-protein kinase [Pirellulaceae bacterium]
MNGMTESMAKFERVYSQTWQKIRAETQRWKQQKVDPDAFEFLRKHGDIRDHPTLVLELAYEEFYLRIDRGEELDVSRFCQRFPLVQRSLRRRIEVDQCLRNKTPELFNDSFRWPDIGDPLLDFRVVAPISMGGFSRVYLCAEKGVGDRQVVVKVARRGAFEADTMGRLSHPNVMPVLSVRTDERTETTCLCMPFVGRSTLRHIVDIAFCQSPPRFASVILEASACCLQSGDRLQQTISPIQIDPNSSYTLGVLQLAIQIASALQHAHEQGVIHGDLKPSNVVVTRLGTPLLVDFNLAHDVDEQMNAVTGGTVPYMAPEKLRAHILSDFGQQDVIGARADVFSFGVMLYELLTGQLPFELPHISRQAVSVVELLRLQANGVSRVNPLNSIVNRTVAVLLERCMAFEPANRMQSMDQIVSLLDREITRYRRLLRGLHDRRSTVTAIAVVGFTGIAAAIWSRGQLGPARDRHYRAGLLLFGEKEFVPALELFGESINDDDQFHQAYFARACAALHARTERHRSVSLDAIETDLKASGALHFDPRILVGHGMVYLTRNDLLTAANCFENAVQHGVQSAVVWNNLGYAYLKTFGVGDAHGIFLRRAAAAFSKAIAMEDTLLSAHYNFSICALACYRSLGDQKMPALGLTSIRKVVAVERGAVPYVYAAKLAGIAAAQDSDDQLWEECITFLEHAYAHGMDVGKYLGNHPFASQSKHPRILDLADPPSIEMSADSPDRIVLPGEILSPDVL